MARSSQYPPSVKPGIPKRPPLPDGWIFLSFGDLLDVVRRPAALKDSDEYQLVTAKRSRGGIVARERLSGSQIKTKTQFFCEHGDFLISRRQIIHGACGVVPSSLSGAVVSNEYSTLRVNGRLLLPYLEALSHTTYFQQTCFQSSIGVDVEKMIFNIRDWLRYEIPVPPLPEQKKIAAILSSLDEAIQATQGVIDQTRRVKEGLLQDLLTRGIGHTRFKESPIGEIPEGWDAVPCAALGRQITVGIVVKPTQYYADQGVKCWRSANVGPGFVRDSDWVYIRPEANDQLSKTRLDAGDIVVVRTGYPGTACVVPTSLDQTNCVDLLFIRPKHDRVLSDYLCWFINSDVGKRQVLAGQGGLAQQHFNVKELNRMVIAVPPLPEQDEIVGHLSEIQASEHSEKAKIAALQKVKAGLLQDLLTGKVRVTV